MEEAKKMMKSHDIFHRWNRLITYFNLRKIKGDLPPSAHVNKRNRNIDAIMIKDGTESDTSVKVKVFAVQSFLFRFEFINSIIIIGSKDLIIFSDKEKLKLVEHLKKLSEKELSDNHNVHLIPFEKKKCEEKDVQKFIQLMVNLGIRNLGYFKKEHQTGQMVQLFDKFIRNTKISFTDITPDTQEFLCVKEDKDIEFLEKASNITCHFFKELIKRVEKVVEEGSDSSHADISSDLDDYLEFKRNTIGEFGVIPNYYDFAYSPVIQSNLKYDLRPNAQSDNEQVTNDCIILNMAGKYCELNILVVRTLLMNPLEEDKRRYKALMTLHNDVIMNLVPGRRLKDIYNQCRQKCLQAYPDLLHFIPKDFGFGMGFEFKEKCLVIGPKNENIVRNNHVYAVITSLKNIVGFKHQKIYSMHLADTIAIMENNEKHSYNGQNYSMTSSISLKLNDIGYNYEEEDNKQDTKGKKKRTYRRTVDVENEDDLLDTLEELKDFKPLKERKTRLAEQKLKMLNDKERVVKRKKHQKHLLDLKMTELEERFKSGNFITKEKKQTKIRLDRLQVYTKETFPSGLDNDKIRIDSKTFALLLPIMGRIVPFHVCVLKNIILQKGDDDFSTLRFNFYTPGIGINNLVFPTLETFTKDISLLQEISFKSEQHDQFASIAKQVKELQKKYKLNEELMEVGKKEKFILKKKLKTLTELKMRPSLTGRKTVGNLTAYANGFKFISKKNEIFELSSGWIKHAIFQPCDENMMIILHFRLNRYILVNKKKTKDVQFFCEVGMVAEDLNDPRKRRLRPEFDEMEEEELETEARQKYNELFLEFIEEVNKESTIGLEFDSPYPEYGFHGSPFYTNNFVIPCAYCLISITENPFFVLTLDEIEIVSIERVDNKIKNFDLIIIFKNYTLPVRAISNIPKSNLEMIKEWLNRNNILFFEGGNLNLRWENILKKICMNPKAFIYKERGWRSFFEDDKEDSSSVEEIEMTDESLYNENDQLDSENSESSEEGFYSEEEEDYFKFFGENEEDSDRAEDSEPEYDFDDSYSPEKKKKKKKILKKGLNSNVKKENEIILPSGPIK
jgi:nucleosome binding factor SPN SPT16 subunit